jgi:hypothetical protein
MEEKKNFFQAETSIQAKKIVSRMKSAGFFTKSCLDDSFFDHIFYPCRFYTDDKDQITIDYTPGGGWKTFKDFVGSWLERPNYKKSLKKI